MQGMICCKFGSELNNEDRFHRRDILQSVGAAVGMVSPLFPFKQDCFVERNELNFNNVVYCDHPMCILNTSIVSNMLTLTVNRRNELNFNMLSCSAIQYAL